MFSKIFIESPILSSVLSIVIVIAGVVTLGGLPVAQYPEITPPTVEVSATYPGASAEVVSETVAALIEQQVNGVENMIYMSSTSASDGSYTLTVTFKVGTDLDMAQVMVQNRVKLAEPNLPEEVKRQGVNTKKKSTSIILFISLFSPEDTHDELFLSNYATLRLKDRLSRVPGVGEVMVFPASDYSMRVWLNPDLLRARAMTTDDVIAAIREQNVQVAAGQIGQPPAPKGQSFQYAVNVLGRLSDIEQFEDIIVKSDEGRITRIRDVARVELGGKSYDITSRLNGSASASIGVYQLPGANALEVATLCREAMEEMSRAFPDGVEYRVPYDTTIFVKQSIDEVFVTLFQAAALVFLVLFIFLQDWRATLIPAVVIPVSLIGTFAVLVFALAIVLVFLVLAAQYESWTAPTAVILVVPLAILGTIFALQLRGLDNNVYTQIGIVLLIALASKNAILIVEFARTQRFAGEGIIDSAVTAARMRFRPILMTAISSIAGFFPLIIATGAGAASRQAIGTAVVGGMIAATVMSLIFTPVFFVVMQWLSEFLGRLRGMEPLPVAASSPPVES